MQMRMMLVMLVMLALPACSSGPTVAPGELATPGVAASITVEELEWAGGQGMRMRTTLDSATATYTTSHCTEIPGVPCDVDRNRRTGSYFAAWRDKLFSEVQSAEFRALRASYPAPAGATPPDYHSGILTVIVNGRTRTITWERRTQLPEALSTFLCHVAVARGSLILCAN